MSDLFGMVGILKDEKLGRYLVASASLKQGTLIFSDTPFALGPKPDSPVVCLGCHTVWNGKYKCSNCDWPCCNSACEQLSIHRDNECHVFASSKSTFQNAPKGQPCLQYDCITPLRLLLAKDRSSERWNKEVVMMEDHKEERMKRLSWDVDQVNIVQYLVGPCKLSDRFSEKLIQKVCGILEVNAVEVPFQHGPNLRAIYPKVAIMSHNCVPSIVHTIVRRRSLRGDNQDNVYLAEVWAATDIKEGEKLEMCYTQVLQPTIERRDFLRLSKFFECDCKRCGDPTELGTEMSTLLCIKCDNGYVRALNPLDSDSLWKCCSCTYTTTDSNVRELLKVINNEIHLAEKFGIENLEQLMEWLRSILHPQHSIFVNMQYNLLQLYGAVKGYELENLPMKLLARKATLCRQVIRFLDVISPGQTRYKGMALFELHAALSHLARTDFKNSLINEKELKKKLFEITDILQESGKILSREDEESEKGIVGREALKSYKNLIHRF